MEDWQIAEEIKKLKKERNAIILSHFYTRREVQEVADFVGDSLSLCKAAVNSKAEIIVFAGVHFMAESASIISPEKVVLLPVPDAGCPMADMVTVKSLREEKEKHTHRVRTPPTVRRATHFVGRLSKRNHGCH